MPQDWEEGRFISLLGDPIGRDGKPESALAPSFKNSDAVTIGSITAGFATILHLVNEPLDISLVGAPFLLGEAIWNRRSEKKTLIKHFGEAAQTKCIDTHPDRNTVSTLDKYGVSAERTRNEYITQSIASTIATAAFGGIFSSLGISWEFNAIANLNPTILELTRCMSGINRFNKVAKGDWVIVDMPKPKPVEQKIGAAAFAGMHA